MSYISDSIPLDETQDRRVKLTSDKKEEVRELYATGEYSMKKLGEMFGVSRSLISIVVNPEMAQKRKDYVKANWRKNYDKEKHKAAVTKTRKYKHQLYLDGYLDEKNKDKYRYPLKE